MRTELKVRHVKFPAPQAGESPAEPINFVFEDEEDAFCDEYIVAGREDDMPALQEYLHESRAD